MGVWSFKIAVVFFLVSPVSNEEDFLELFIPNPSLPNELNDFLSDVQEHKEDFREIRELAKRNIHRERKHNSDGYEDLINWNAKPGNDIYPYMYGDDNKVRYRRTIKEDVKVKDCGEIGEVAQNFDKYPDRFKVKKSVSDDLEKVGIVKERNDGIGERKQEIYLKKDEGAVMDKFIENGKFDKPVVVRILHVDDNSYEEATPKKKSVENNGILKQLLDTNAKTVNLNQNKVQGFKNEDYVDTNEDDGDCNKDSSTKYSDMSDYWSISEKQEIEKGIERARGEESQEKAKVIAMALNLKTAEEPVTEPRNGFEVVESISIDPTDNEDPSFVSRQDIASRGDLKKKAKNHQENEPQYSSIILEPKTQGKRIFNPQEEKSENFRPTEAEEDYSETQENVEVINIRNDDDFITQPNQLNIDPNLLYDPYPVNHLNSYSDFYSPDHINQPWDALIPPNDRENRFLLNNLINRTIDDVTNNLRLHKPFLGKRHVHYTPRMYKTHNMGGHSVLPALNSDDKRYQEILNDLIVAAKMIKNGHTTARYKKSNDIYVANPKRGKGINPRLPNNLKHHTEDHSNNELDPTKILHSRKILSIEEFKNADNLKPKNQDSYQTAEGDYGDEEDIGKEKVKKIKAVKKTDNKFANPISRIGDIDDYLVEEINKSKVHPEFVDYDVASFAHHGVKPALKIKMKRTTEKKKYPHPIVTSREELTEAEGSWRHYQRNDQNDQEDQDFQHWPKYVVDDMQKREQIKKRALIPDSNSTITFTDEYLISTTDMTKRMESNETTTVMRTINNSTEAISACKSESFTIVFTPRTTTPLPTTTAPSTTTADYSGTLIPINNNEMEMEEDDGNYNFDDFLSGDISNKILQDVNDDIENDIKLKRRFRLSGGPQRQFLDLCPTETPAPVTANQPQELLLAKKLLDSVNKILHAYIGTFKAPPKVAKAESKCKQLTNGLKEYLNSITMLTKCESPLMKAREMEDDDSDLSTQPPFLFKLKNNEIVVEQNKRDEVNTKITRLKQLLDKYEKLPPKCKLRAKPVKEYIHQHLQMLNHISHSNSEHGNQAFEISQPINVPHNVDSLVTSVPEADSIVGQDPVEQELESVGLGKKSEDFRPNFNLNDMMMNYSKPQPHIGIGKRELRAIPTKRFLKLFDAVRHLRQRRESERRIAELYSKDRTQNAKVLI